MTENTEPADGLVMLSAETAVDVDADCADGMCSIENSETN